MRTSKRNATVILEPNHDAAALGIGARMIRTGNAITIAVARDDEKGLKWTGEQELSNIRNHEARD